MNKPINGRALCYEQIAWAYEKWCEGYTYEELGDALAVSYKTIRRSFDYYGSTIGEHEKQERRYLYGRTIKHI